VPADSEWITRQPEIIRRTCHEPEVPFEDMNNAAVGTAFELTQNSVRTSIQLARM
jgi:hypothetical protein